MRFKLIHFEGPIGIISEYVAVPHKNLKYQNTSTLTNIKLEKSDHIINDTDHNNNHCASQPLWVRIFQDPLPSPVTLQDCLVYGRVDVARY